MRSRTSVFTALVLFVGILGFAPESVHAQDVGTVAGTVTGPGGAPIGDVAVSIIGVNIVGQTNAEWIYLLLNVPAGNHGVQAAESDSLRSLSGISRSQPEDGPPSTSSLKRPGFPCRTSS